MDAMDAIGSKQQNVEIVLLPAITGKHASCEQAEIASYMISALVCFMIFFRKWVVFISFGFGKCCYGSYLPLPRGLAHWNGLSNPVVLPEDVKYEI